ncbi:hypothetical protein V8E36_007049 [Tilletia maclaganii]
MSIPRYSPSTGRFERGTDGGGGGPSSGSRVSRSDSIDSTDFGAFVDASSDPDPFAATAAAAAAEAPNNEDLFHAFEQAAIEQSKHRPSPPPIDLRSVESKLGTDILIPRRNPSHTGSSSNSNSNNHYANIEVLMGTASTSPSITRLDASVENLASSNAAHSSAGAGPSSAANTASSSAFSFFDLNLLDPQHANPDRPSLDPALLEDDPALLKEQLSLKRRQNSLAHARDYEGGSAPGHILSNSSNTTALHASSASSNKHRSPFPSLLPSGPAPISGAPGFDARAERNWNTGHWKFDVEHDPVVGPGTSPLSASHASLRSATSSSAHPRASTLPTPSSSSSHSAGPARSQTGNSNLDQAQAEGRAAAAAAAALTIRRPIQVTLTERHELTSEVIMPWHASHLQAALPPRLRLGRTWRLLYSLDQHGMSLATLYNNVAKGLDPSSRAARSSGGGGGDIGDGYMRGASAAARGAVGLAGSTGALRKVGGGLSITEAGLVLAVKDADDNVFGAFINERLRPKSGYYGSGECFLWKTTRQPASLSKLNPSLDPSRIKTFRWTGRNDYVLLTESSFLSIGSGDNGRYGLWLDSSLEKGVSSRCSTFGNDVLCDDEPGGEEQDGGGELAAANLDSVEEGKTKGAKSNDPFGMWDSGADDDGDEAKFEVMGLEVWAVGID